MPYGNTHTGGFFERLEDSAKSSIWFRLTGIPNEKSWTEFQSAFTLAYGVYPRFDMIIECVVRLKDIPPQYIISMLAMIKQLIPRSKKQIRCTAIVTKDAEGIRGIMAKRPPSTDWRFADTMEEALNYTAMKLERETKGSTATGITRVTKAKCIDVFMRVAFDLLDEDDESSSVVVPDIVSVPSSC